MHICLLPPSNPEVETAQASSAGPAELRGQGSLQMHNISSRWLLSAGRCCSAAGRDEMNLQSMRRIPDTPAKEDHTVYNVTCFCTLDDGAPLLLLTPPPRVKGITPPPMLSPHQLSSQRATEAFSDYISVEIPGDVYEKTEDLERRRAVEESECEVRGARCGSAGVITLLRNTAVPSCCSQPVFSKQLRQVRHGSTRTPEHGTSE